MTDSAPNEYVRRCKQDGCPVEFVVSGPSLTLDRMIGYSDPEYCPAHRLRHARSYSRIAMHHPDAEESEWGRQVLSEYKSERVLDLGPGGLGQFRREPRPLEQGEPSPEEQIRFPIAEKDAEILAGLDRHRVLVLVGPTGSGKSTHVPHLLLRSRWSRYGPIVVTQPRIQATRQIPAFVARLNRSGFGPGREIGYAHSGADEYDRRTRLLFMTDGKLINDIVSGRIGNYSVVMIDEAHERSVNIDLILGLMKEQLALYPHLRLVIASATIDHRSFVDFYGGASRVAFVESKGRSFPVEPHWWGEGEWWKDINDGELPERDDLFGAISDLVKQLWRGTPAGRAGVPADLGHILIFLPGTREIDLTVAQIRALALPGILCLPLYATRPFDEQERALNPKAPEDKKLRRVIVSTNVAETSLTVEGVRHVIDSGYIKESNWNPLGRVTELRTLRHSQAGCKQRWGRAGRVAPGESWHLYTRDQFETRFPPYTAPGIARTSMEEVILTLAAAGVHNAREFPWIPMQAERDNVRFRHEREKAFVELPQRNIIDEEGDLTAFGLELRGVQTGIDSAMAFALGDRYAMGIEVATLLPFLKLDHGIQALLSREEDLVADIRDDDQRRKVQLSIRHQRLALFAGCKDDLDLYVKLWLGWTALSGQAREQWCQLVGINARAFRDNIEKQRERLVGSLADRRKAEQRDIQIEKLDAFRALLAHALPHALYIPESSLEIHHRNFGGDVEADDIIGPNDTSGQRIGVYRRRQPRPGEMDEEALVEISSDSVVLRGDAPLCCLICQRKANFLRPARTAVLGVSVIRIDPPWLDGIGALHTERVVERAMLFAQLSRLRSPEQSMENRKRLLLSSIMPIDAKLNAILLKRTERGRWLVEVPVAGSPYFVDQETVTVEVSIDVDDVAGLAPSIRLDGRVARYDGATPVLRCSDDQAALKAFRDRFQIGHPATVVTRHIVHDPVGRLPFVVVREETTGLDISMLPADFCGETAFFSEFALRFAPGDRFPVRVEETKGSIRVSRAQTLLEETLSVPVDWDRKVQQVYVRRVDALGAWVEVGDYIALVGRGAWPTERAVEVGSRLRGVILARLRKRERDAFVKARAEGRPIPGGVELGYKVDLRAPETYARFMREHNKGSLVEATVDRVLDDGGLIVRVAEQRIRVAEEELGLDATGALRRARDFYPGDLVTIMVTRVQEDRALVDGSIWRAATSTRTFAHGEIVNVRIILVRKTPRPLCVGAIDGKHRIELAYEGGSDGDWVKAKISRVDPVSAWILGEVTA